MRAPLPWARTPEREALGLTKWPAEFFQGLVFKTGMVAARGAYQRYNSRRVGHLDRSKASDLPAMTFAATF